MILMDFNGFTS